jgi:hypothetical protein
MNAVEQQIIEGTNGTTALRVDFVGDYIYKGVGPVGAVDSEPTWRIARIYTHPTTGAVTTLWADGNSRMDNVWTDRLTITYQ